MTYLKKIIYLFSTIIYLQGCSSVEIDYIHPITAKKLVVYCFFNPDSVWTVQVSKLGSVTDVVSDNLLINNAIVTIHENNKVIDTLKFKETGFYTSESKLKPAYNKKYQLQVSCDGYEKLYSTQESLPSPISISGVKVHHYLFQNIFSKETYNDTLWYKQKTVESNLSFEKGQFLRISTTHLENRVEWGVSVALNNMTYLTKYESRYGNIFEVKETANIKLQTAVYYDSDKLRLMTISPHFLLYEVSYAEYEFVVNTTKILTPNNVFSNIIGGGGIFVGYTLKIIDL
jgi:hypothetical protein